MPPARRSRDAYGMLRDPGADNPLPAPPAVRLDPARTRLAAAYRT